jgi:hypothetical protein
VRWWGWVRRSSSVVRAPAPAVVAATPFLSLPLLLLLLPSPSFTLPLPLLLLVLPLPFLLPLLLPLPPLLRSHSHSHSCYCCRRRCWFCCCCSHSHVRAFIRADPTRSHLLAFIHVCLRSFCACWFVWPSFGFVRARSCYFGLVGLSACSPASRLCLHQALQS